MLPYLEIFGRTFPSYSVLGSIGILLGLGLVLLYCDRFGLDREDCAYIYIFGAVGAMVGAKILHLITVFPDVVRDLHLLWTDPVQFAGLYLSGGLVFYGGLAGAVAGAALSAHYFSRRLRDFFPLFVPVFPLIHAVGRVGCFMVGCCYGKEANWGIAFSQSLAAPNGVKLIPVQLFEAGADVLIFLLLLWYVHHRPAPIHLLVAYLLSYAPVRFVLEFFRGDVVRGIYGPFSTSQWISLAIVVLSVVLLIQNRRQQAKAVSL